MLLLGWVSLMGELNSECEYWAHLASCLGSAWVTCWQQWRHNKGGWQQWWTNGVQLIAKLTKLKYTLRVYPRDGAQADCLELHWSLLCRQLGTACCA
jgi:hypothetical protein